MYKHLSYKKSTRTGHALETKELVDAIEAAPKRPHQVLDDRFLTAQWTNSHDLWHAKGEPQALRNPLISYQLVFPHHDASSLSDMQLMRCRGIQVLNCIEMYRNI